MCQIEPKHIHSCQDLQHLKMRSDLSKKDEVTDVCVRGKYSEKSGCKCRRKTCHARAEANDSAAV